MSSQVIVAELPECSFYCNVPATYDFRTKQGPWAYGCEQHWKWNRATDKLGTGNGQRLVVPKPESLPDPQAEYRRPEASLAPIVDVVLIPVKQVRDDGAEGLWTTEASSVGFAPGDWPEVVKLVDVFGGQSPELLRNQRHLATDTGELLCVSYRGPGHLLRIWND